LVSIPQDIFKAVPLYLGNLPNWENLSNARLLEVYSEYLRSVAFWLFLSLLILHALAARLYRSAMLKALREGLLHPEDLQPQLREYLERMELMPALEEKRGGLARVLRWTWNWYVLRILYAAVILLALVYVGKTYLNQFFIYRPFVGFMNDPL